MEFLDDRSADRRRVLTLDDNRTPGAVDHLLHENISAFVGSLPGLPDLFVPEIAKHALHEVLKLEPGEVVQDCHRDVAEVTVLGYIFSS